MPYFFDQMLFSLFVLVRLLIEDDYILFEGGVYSLGSRRIETATEIGSLIPRPCSTKFTNFVLQDLNFVLQATNAQGLGTRLPEIGTCGRYR